MPCLLRWNWTLPSARVPNKNPIITANKRTEIWNKTFFLMDLINRTGWNRKSIIGHQHNTKSVQKIIVKILMCDLKPHSEKHLRNGLCMFPVHDIIFTPCAVLSGYVICIYLLRIPNLNKKLKCFYQKKFGPNLVRMLRKLISELCYYPIILDLAIKF